MEKLGERYFWHGWHGLRHIATGIKPIQENFALARSLRSLEHAGAPRESTIFFIAVEETAMKRQLGAAAQKKFSKNSMSLNE